MARKSFFASAVVFGALLMVTAESPAINLMSRDDAVPAVLGPGHQLVAESKDLAPRLSRIKERLGGSLIYANQAARGVDSPALHADFIFAVKDGRKVGVAVYDVEPGRWGPIEFMIALDPDNGTVTRVVVISYEEKTGRPIGRGSFLSQFTGKGIKDKFVLGEDITQVSGATISAESAVFAVKKAIVLYDELYLKK
ncbi:MAG: FMN-binding protein [Endomicrobiales bacterium]